MEKLRACKNCGRILTPKNTYSTFWKRDNRCKECHIQYMRDLRLKQKLQREKEEQGESFFSFGEEDI